MESCEFIVSVPLPLYLNQCGPVTPIMKLFIRYFVIFRRPALVVVSFFFINM